MKREQIAILAPLVARMRKALPRHWEELKRAAWDNCEAATNHWAGEFRGYARRMLDALPAADREKLLTSFRREHPTLGRDDAATVDYVESQLIEILVQRATTAAYRTVEW